MHDVSVDVHPSLREQTDGFGKTNRYVCFSSPDLTTWTAHGEILKDAPPRTYYRPYVKFNKRSAKYVMWYNADNQYGVAVADRPAGPFTVSFGIEAQFCPKS